MTVTSNLFFSNLTIEAAAEAAALNFDEIQNSTTH